MRNSLRRGKLPQECEEHFLPTICQKHYGQCYSSYRYSLLIIRCVKGVVDVKMTQDGKGKVAKARNINKVGPAEMHGESLDKICAMSGWWSRLEKINLAKNHPWLARRTRDIYIIRFLPWSGLPTCSAAHILTQVILCPGDWYQLLYILYDVLVKQDVIENVQ